MGRKKGWFSAVKKAFNPYSKKNQKAKSRTGNEENDAVEETAPSTEQLSGTSFPQPAPSPPALPVVTKSTEIVIDDEQNRHAYSVAVATAAVAEAAVAAAQAAAEVVRLTTFPRFVGKSKEEIAAIKIQTAFRGYLARRALRALRGLLRLKSLIEGQSVKRQTATTLRCMQTLARVQSQIRARRVRMSEENLALQRQLNLKHEKELEHLRMGETWDVSPQSKEQVEANLQSKQDAAMRRERALAYAFTHQQLRKNNKNTNATFMDPNNPQWGWSWMERWMAARPWESKSMADKESNENGLVKSFRPLSVAGEINRAYALRDLSRQSPSTPTSGKAKPGIPKPNGSAETLTQDEDTKSTMSIRSEKQFRRHSVSGSSIRDDESLASSHTVPSYMTATRSAKAKTKLASPLGGSDQKPPIDGSTKKRLSFSASPRTPRRHSVPGKLESIPVKDVPVQIFVQN